MYFLIVTPSRIDKSVKTQSMFFYHYYSICLKSIGSWICGFKIIIYTKHSFLIAN